ncbi:hypothetical protein K6W36_09715 [Acetobacter senegalensis]|nr:hypothetical protein [Acetobacter senegalensis]MCG4260861.1 hypothetical protein [Acetobacter senegalensis]
MTLSGTAISAVMTGIMQSVIGVMTPEKRQEAAIFSFPCVSWLLRV